VDLGHYQHGKKKEERVRVGRLKKDREVGKKTDKKKICNGVTRKKNKPYKGGGLEPGVNSGKKRVLGRPRTIQTRGECKF